MKTERLRTASLVSSVLGLTIFALQMVRQLWENKGSSLKPSCLAIQLFGVAIAMFNRKKNQRIVRSIGEGSDEVMDREYLSTLAPESQYRSMFENAVEGIFQTTPDGQYISANPALAAIYGYASPSELIGQLTDIEHQLYVYPRDRTEFNRLLEEGDVVSGFEAEVYRKDGSIIWISENARGVRDDRGKLLYYEGFVVDITERKRTEEQLRYNAHHDYLTGLWNRVWFIDRVKQALSSDGLFAVLFMDLDGFKFINDSLGYRMGNRLLREIALRLQICLGPNDILARFGGDEFTVFLADIEDIQDATRMAEKFKTLWQNPFNLEGYEVFVGASIGIVQGNSEYEDPQELLQDADIAMYRAKAKGKGGYVVFDREMRKQIIRHLQLETELHWAIARQEFEVYYQPIVRLATGDISGFEALVRWRHPQHDFVSPSEFIPVAEEVGLIGKIGELVLRSACRQLRQWKKMFPSLGSLKMSVNVSGKQLTADFGDRVEAILDETGVSGCELKLEITETTLMADPEAVIPTLTQLREQNIQLCIDDFGTGYSSFSYLHRLPIDVLKVDRSFVSQMSVNRDNFEIVKAIIALARGLGMETISEGVESIDHVNQLQLLKCKYGQGYFFSKPLNSEAAGKLLASYQMDQMDVV